MAEATTTDEKKSTTKTAKTGKRGDIVDVKVGATVIDPRGVQRTMGGDKYVLDQAGTHVVDGQAYDVADED